VPQIRLDAAGVAAVVREFETTGVPKHVRVDLEAEADFPAGAFDHFGEAGRGEWRAALRQEDELRVRRLAAELAERAERVALKRMRRRLSALPPADVQHGMFEVHLRPFKVADLGSPEAMPESHRHHESVPDAVAVLPGRLDKRVDFRRCQVFPGTKFGVRPAARRGNCPIYSVRDYQFER
jgi:hypothetical protein